MKTGRSLQEVATELARQQSAKRDFLVDTRNVHVREDMGKLLTVFAQGGGKELVTGVRPHALRQVEEHLGIPAKFADHLGANYPDLLAHNLNELLHRKPTATTQLVRLLDGDMRAFLSNSYRRIDNFDFANAVLEVAQKFPTEVLSCEVTETRLYIKVVRTDMEKRIGYKEGWRQGQGHNLYNRLRAAAVFSNSEIGSGALWFRPAVFTNECTNLAVWEEESFQKVHLGKKGDAGEAGFWELFSDRTKELSDAALWSQVKDMAAASLGGLLFDKQIEMLEGATQKPITGEVVKTVELTAKTYQLNETEKKGVLDHLIKGGDLSQYGLHSAITRYSQDVENYDRASELERLGGRIIELKPNEWERLAEAA